MALFDVDRTAALPARATGCTPAVKSLSEANIQGAAQSVSCPTPDHGAYRTSGAKRSHLPEVDRSLSSRLREQAEETGDEVGRVTDPSGV